MRPVALSSPITKGSLMATCIAWIVQHPKLSVGLIGIGIALLLPNLGVQAQVAQVGEEQCNTDSDQPHG